MRERVSGWVSALSAPIGHVLNRLARLSRIVQLGVLELITGMVVVGLALLLLMLRDRIGLWASMHLSIAPSQHAIVQLYARMLRTLEKKGMAKLPAVTAAEFSRQVERKWEAAGPVVADVTALYYQGRFSRVPLLPEELSRAAEQVGRLQSLLRTIH